MLASLCDIGLHSRDGTYSIWCGRRLSWVRKIVGWNRYVRTSTEYLRLPPQVALLLTASSVYALAPPSYPATCV